MTAPISQKLSVTLSTEMARLVREKVASGAYQSESDVIDDSLHALQDRDAAIETWLRDEVATTYDTFKRNPERATPLSDVSARLASFMHSDAK